MAGVLWDLVLGLFGVQWVFPETVKEVLFSWKGPFMGKKVKRFGNPFRCTFFGRFGKERNRLAFRGRGGVSNSEAQKLFCL